MILKSWIHLEVEWDSNHHDDPRHWDWEELINSDGSPHPNKVRVISAVNALPISQGQDDL